MDEAELVDEVELVDELELVDEVELAEVLELADELVLVASLALEWPDVSVPPAEDSLALSWVAPVPDALCDVVPPDVWAASVVVGPVAPPPPGETHSPERHSRPGSHAPPPVHGQPSVPTVQALSASLESSFPDPESPQAEGPVTRQTANKYRMQVTGTPRRGQQGSMLTHDSPLRMVSHGGHGAHAPTPTTKAQMHREGTRPSTSERVLR